MTLLFLAALGAGVVLFVLFPVFARSGEVSRRPTAESRERKSLADKKERIYEAIKDADFEYQAGKLSESDYRSMRADFLAQAATVVDRLDKLDKLDAIRQPGDLGQRDEQESHESSTEASVCPSCQKPNPPGAQFCFRCGVRIAAPNCCPQCRAELPKEARFCTACGVAIPA